MSAAELMARLQSDPEFVRKNEQREAQRKEMEAQLGAEEQALVAELAGVGVRVASVWDLVNEKSSYAAAIPVLTRHVKLPYHPKIREGIARALTVKEARGSAGGVILDELQRADEKSHEVRWALANALTEAADNGMAAEIEALVTDDRFNDVREVLKLALKNLAAR